MSAPETTPNSCTCGSCSCSDKDARIADLTERVHRLGSAINAIDMMLRVPAAEYVPAIQDAFAIIDRAKLGREVRLVSDEPPTP
jgi:hypothetical protein